MFLNYKKPGFWIIFFSIIIMAVGIGLIANHIKRERYISMNIIKYLAKISYQSDELLVSRAPGKDEGFNVPARAIAEYLYNVKWNGREIDSPPELSATLKIEWSEDRELLLYESEPRLAIVRLGDQWRRYKSGRNDYETLISIIETTTDP